MEGGRAGAKRMQYFGGKKAIVDYLLEVMVRARGDRPWVEPFVGSGGVIERVRGGVRIGGDANPYIIALLRAVRDGWDPPGYVSRGDYERAKGDYGAFEPELVGYIGVGVTRAGKWFGTYDGDVRAKASQKPDRSSRALIASRPLFQGVRFYYCDYRDLKIPRGSLIYCDPPYAGTGGEVDGYITWPDSGEFWEWCFERSNEGHLVFVSEYSAPAGVPCIFEIPVKSGAAHKDGKLLPRTERLYCLDPRVRPAGIPRQLEISWE